MIDERTRRLHDAYGILGNHNSRRAIVQIWIHADELGAHDVRGIDTRQQLRDLIAVAKSLFRVGMGLSAPTRPVGHRTRFGNTGDDGGQLLAEKLLQVSRDGGRIAANRLPMRSIT